MTGENRLRDIPDQNDDLTAVVQFLLKRWFVLVVAALFGVSAGLAVFMLGEQTYVARQQFVMQGVVNQSQTVQLGAAASSPGSLIATQQGILEGDGLRKDVENEIGRAVGPLLTETTETSLSYTIAVEDSSPELARTALVGYTSAYLDYLKTEGSAQITQQIGLTQQRIEQLQREIRAAARNDMASPSLNDQINSQQAILAQLKLQQVTGTTVVAPVGEEVVPSTPTSPSALTRALIGGAFAVFVAAVGLALASRLRSAVRSTHPMAAVALPVQQRTTRHFSRMREAP